MVAMVQRLDARSFFFYPQLIVTTFLALVLKVFRNRFSCHGRSVAELSPSKLLNFDHSEGACAIPDAVVLSQHDGDNPRVNCVKHG